MYSSREKVQSSGALDGKCAIALWLSTSLPANSAPYRSMLTLMILVRILQTGRQPGWELLVSLSFYLMSFLTVIESTYGPFQARVVFLGSRTLAGLGFAVTEWVRTSSQIHTPEQHKVCQISNGLLRGAWGEYWQDEVDAEHSQAIMAVLFWFADSDDWIVLLGLPFTILSFF